jgi:Protein of unknown function (DUF4012)
MTSTVASSRPIRRNRITTSDAVLIGCVSAASALGGALAGAHPTAWAPADALLTAAAAAFVAWCGASAPWWLLAGTAGVAVLTASSPAWMAAGVVGFVVAAVIGARRSSWPVGRAASAGLTINALLHWGSAGFHGLTAIVTGTIAAAIVVGGLQRRRHLVRRTVYRVLAVIALVAVVAALGATVAVARAVGDARAGERALRDGAAALGDGDIDAAVAALAETEERIGRASDELRSPWARPALAVPVVGQHVAVTADLARDLEALSSTLAVTAGQINVDSLRVESGVIDVDAIELLGPPLSSTEAVLADAADSLAEYDSDWLVPPAADTVEAVRDEVDRLLELTRTAITAVEVAPSMLGRDEPRTYFVAFTTPAEARGIGGFMGTWAELVVDDGRLSVTATGQTTELTQAMNPDPVLDGPDDYVERYGRFGAGADGAPVSLDFWSNVTMSPDFPSVTEVVAQMYPASGGSDIDGAIVIDVETVARFLDLTGPISVAGPDGAIRLDASNAQEYLLRRQYADIDDDEIRDAVLEELTSRLLADVFGGSLPGPTVLASTLGPAMDEGRLLMWSRHPDDQLALEELGIGGELPPPAPDGFAVVSNNAAANKLDAYLKRNIAYEAVVDEATGTITATAEVRLVNSAPSGLPGDVGGNPFGLPPGTNRMYLSMYSPWSLTGAELDGEPTGLEPSMELGWNVYSRFVEIPAGEEVVLRLAFEGDLPSDEPYELVLRSQPLAFPDVTRVDVRTTDGEILHQSHEVRVGVDRLGGE